MSRDKHPGHIFPEDQKMKPPYTPMEMSPFERKLVEEEKIERMLNRRAYQKGIHGIDGGKFESDWY